MNLQREFIRKSIAYYMANPGLEGMTESKARRHANADLAWWREELNKALDRVPYQDAYEEHEALYFDNKVTP